LRFVALVLGVVVLSTITVARAAPAAAGAGYQPPVAAPVSDPFRPPADDYSAGNRGIEYATTPGTEVRAAADGDVVFAGEVGGTLHVVILHGDGIRTSYSYLAALRVQRGDAVRQGQVIGITGDRRLHFGARAGAAYVDPALLFGAGPPQVHLVPDSERRAGTAEHERNGLLGFLGDVADAASGAAGAGAGATARAVSWAAGGAADAGQWALGRAADAGLAALRRQTIGSLSDLRQLAERCVQFSPVATVYRTASAARAFFDRGECTPAGVAPPPVHGHIAVLVGGLGSSGSMKDGVEHGGAAIFRLDTAALGYQPADVLHFSYRGGTTAEHPYGKADTEVDIRRSGARLRALLERIQYEHPGVTVDVLAHSQGGLVTRAALADGYDRFDPRMPRLGAVVTMGSPHHGTDGATTVAMLRRDPIADVALAGVHHAMPAFDDPRATSISQMSEGSSFIGKLNDTPLPNGVYVTSIAAREDWLVPAAHTHLAGAHNVVVDVPSTSAHDALPGSAAAFREAALALNRMPPTCHSVLTAVADAVVSEGIRHAERGLRRQFLPMSGGTP
jgi:Peptidase family M23/Putative serine esterase (DUF676)